MDGWMHTWGEKAQTRSPKPMRNKVFGRAGIGFTTYELDDRVCTSL